jgi:hypothetical protein
MNAVPRLASCSGILCGSGMSEVLETYEIYLQGLQLQGQPKRV